QVGESDAIADSSILIIVIGLHESALRIDDFEYASFAALVAQCDQALTFSGKFSGAPQARQLVQRSFGFGVQGANLRNQLALRVRKFQLRLFLLKLRLADSALRRPPIPHREIKRSKSRRTNVG